MLIAVALAASLSLGAASESFRRSTGSDPGKGSVFMSDANVRRLVASLGKMRGAALKLGQFMSIQGELPEALTASHGSAADLRR